MRDAITLIKTHSYGNDFLLVSAAGVTGVDDLPALARRVCDRHTGLGADGLMVLAENSEGARTRLFNADGSFSELSGNGARCAAAWIAESRNHKLRRATLIGTDAGMKELTLLEKANKRYTFRAAMGAVEDLREEQLEVAGRTVTAAVMRVGNPQCVVIGPVTEERLQTIAAGLAVHPFFPDGTNVELVEVEDPNRIRILIWERGVGPTRASGTGACAAAVAAASYGGANRSVEVVSPGGSQRVTWGTDGLWLTGWAEVVAQIEWWP
jgi:diaminopimelate epimerase